MIIKPWVKTYVKLPKRGKIPNNFQSTSLTNLILSSLVSDFLQRIQESKARFFFFFFFFFLGGGGGGYGGLMNMKAAIFFYTTHCHDLFYRTVLFHDINPERIQNREHCSLIKGK